MYTLEEIFEQAKADGDCVQLLWAGYEAYLGNHYKISRCVYSNEITIQNTTGTGNYYMDLNLEEANLFAEKGWRFASLTLSLSNYRTKLDNIERLIHKEVNGTSNPKHIASLQHSRDRIMELYSITIKKLSKHGNNENTI